MDDFFSDIQCSYESCDTQVKCLRYERAPPSVPCSVEVRVMAGLLLLGLLACAPAVLTEIPVLVLSELCYYPLKVDYIDQEDWNMSLRLLPTEGIAIN